MNNINWKVRFANKNFWLTFIPAVLLLVQVVLALFNVTFDYSDLAKKLMDIVNAVFGVLVIVGIVNDPTTHGVGDSVRAMTYEKPYDDNNPVETK